jgi:hypothetical protein
MDRNRLFSAKEISKYFSLCESFQMDEWLLYFPRHALRKPWTNYIDVSNSTGYGQHGDYVFGWKGDVLQKAMDAGCFGATCSQLKTQSFTDANKCAVSRKTTEDVDGCELTMSIL